MAAASPPSVTELVRSLHRKDPLRNWVSLESRALLPHLSLETPPDGKSQIHVLLCVPSTQGVPVWPWGLVSWSWPEGEVLATHDLRAHLPPAESPTLVREYLASPDYLATVDQALATGNPPPSLPEPLHVLYRMALATAQQDPEVPQATSEPESARPSADLNPDDGVHLVNLLTRTRQLLDECGQESLTKEWQRIRARLLAPQFSVVVAGEFSRGKSSFLNQLLSRSLLPTSQIPGKAPLTRIAYDLECSAALLLPDGSRQNVALDELAYLGKDTKDGLTPGVLTVLVDDPWLKDHRLQLVDTPGFGVADDDRTALTLAAISSADAVLFAVSATMPLSLSEQGFFEQCVLSQQIPHIAALVTRLDQVRPVDRPAVLAHIRRKLPPEVPLWTAQEAPLESGSSHLVVANGLDAIRTHISTWSQSPTLHDLRRSQIITQLAALLAELNTVLSDQHDLLALTIEDEAEGLAAAKKAQQRQQLSWGELRIELTERQSRICHWLQQRLQKQADEITHNLTYALQRTPLPAQWWEQDLPLLLRRELATLSRALDPELQKRVTLDVQWVSTYVLNQLSWKLHFSAPGSLVQETVTTSSEPSGLENLSRKRLYMRLAFGAATVASFALFGPLGMAMSIGTGILNEQIMSLSADKQREVLATKLGPLIQQALEEASADIAHRLRKVYDKMLAESKEQEARWKEAQLVAANAIHDNQDLPNQLTLVTRQLEMLAAIRSELDPSPRKDP